MGPNHGYHMPLIGAYLRSRATLLSERRPDVLDMGITGSDCHVGFLSNITFLDLFESRDICKHKYLLQLDGNGISGRSTHLFSSGSLVFKPDSVFSEWYYHNLRPWVHYVPVHEFLEDVVEQVEWIKANPAAAMCIANNAKIFAKQHLTKENVACYWWRLLSAWARQQTQGSRTEGFTPV